VGQNGNNIVVPQKVKAGRAISIFMLNFWHSCAGCQAESAERKIARVAAARASVQK